MMNYLKERHRLAQTKFSFGAASAIITNLGLISGLRTGEHAKLSIIGAILVIALADNISDSVGIHIYQESECLKTKEVWISTLTNFLTRILVSLTFILPLMVLPIKVAVVCAISWGLLLLVMMSYAIAKGRQINPYLAMLEHLCIAIIVIIASNFVGKLLITKLKL
jgi:VIT1/CCC1 family predicted Fe2+/Mn2+ transporter